MRPILPGSSVGQSVTRKTYACIEQRLVDIERSETMLPAMRAPRIAFATSCAAPIRARCKSSIGDERHATLKQRQQQILGIVEGHILARGNLLRGLPHGTIGTNSEVEDRLYDAPLSPTGTVGPPQSSAHEPKRVFLYSGMYFAFGS
jgi:hypothetical protein